jgi:hypothetical protein
LPSLPSSSSACIEDPACFLRAIKAYGFRLTNITGMTYVEALL